MAKQITFRALRQNLRKYLDRMEKGDLFEIRGHLLGFLIETPLTAEEIADLPPEIKKSMPLKELKEKITAIEDRDVTTSPPVPSEKIIGDLSGVTAELIEYDQCDLCSKQVQLYNFFDETDHKVCEACLRSKLGKGATKYLAKANMIVKL